MTAISRRNIVDAATMLFLVLGLVFAVLLGLEWRHRSSGIALVTAVLALLILFVAQPSPTRAARWAATASPSQRSQEIGQRLSEYEHGVETMRQAMARDSEAGAPARLLAVAVLFWLACAPVRRKARVPRAS